jgi:hypothetical protein
MDINLKAKHIFVRAGELYIGNVSEPFEAKATITLYGEKANEHIVFDGAVEAGNKLIANTGKIFFYGKQRENRVSRLTKAATPSSNKIYVGKNLDWKVGDRIAIAPTGVKFNETDEAVITAYDASSGEVTLDSALRFQHYGAATSTASSYSGVDIRAEVAVLTRNILIKAQDIENWGC